MFVMIVEQDMDYIREESDAGKVTNIFWASNVGGWHLRYKDTSDKHQNELFLPRHFDLPTNSEQVRAAHHAAVVRKKVLEKTGQIQVKLFYLEINNWFYRCVQFCFNFLLQAPKIKARQTAEFDQKAEPVFWFLFPKFK